MPVPLPGGLGRGRPDLGPRQLRHLSLGVRVLDQGRRGRVVRDPDHLAQLLGRQRVRRTRPGGLQGVRQAGEPGRQLAAHLLGTTAPTPRARRRRERDRDVGLHRGRTGRVPVDHLTEHRCRERRGVRIQIRSHLPAQPGPGVRCRLDGHGGRLDPGLIGEIRQPVTPVRDPCVHLILIHQRGPIRVRPDDDGVAAGGRGL